MQRESRKPTKISDITNKVAEAHGYKSANSVYRVLQRNNVKRVGSGKNQPQRKITDEQLIEACKTITRQEIADAYGMHIATIDRRTSKLGIHAVSITREVSRHPRYQRTWDEYVSKVKEEAEKRKAQKEKEKAINNTIRIIWAIAEKKKDKYCAECGSVFHSEYPNKIYCSDKCKRKHRDRLRRKGKKNNSIRHRCRKYGVYYDPAVTREKVIERDNGICQICGKVCDPFDLRWGFSGPNFPTLDHIIALANGGNHTWDNVQCACGECNSYKRDLTEERRLEWLGLGKL